MTKADNNNDRSVFIISEKMVAEVYAAIFHFDLDSTSPRDVVERVVDSVLASSDAPIRSALIARIQSL